MTSQSDPCPNVDRLERMSLPANEIAGLVRIASQRAELPAAIWFPITGPAGEPRACAAYQGVWATDEGGRTSGPRHLELLIGFHSDADAHIGFLNLGGQSTGHAEPTLNHDTHLREMAENIGEESISGPSSSHSEREDSDPDGFAILFRHGRVTALLAEYGVPLDSATALATTRARSLSGRIAAFDT